MEQSISQENYKEAQNWIYSVISDVLGWNPKNYLAWGLRNEPWWNDGPTTWRAFHVEEWNERINFTWFPEEPTIYHESVKVYADIINNRDVEGLCEVLKDAFENCPDRLATDEEIMQYGEDD